jgi:hypothetical protein
MDRELPQSAAKIMDDYLNRTSFRLAGMPGGDRQDLLHEIRAQIIEGYGKEFEGDEIDRMLRVLKQLGDPADVIAGRMPKSGERPGIGRKAPLYVLAGVLIALFGIPLGLGAVGLLVGLMAALFGLLIAYYGLGISLAVSGTLCSVFCLIAAISPGLLDRVNYALGTEVIHFGPFANDPELGGTLGLIFSLLMTGLGVLILRSGKHLWRGFRFVAVLITQKVLAIFGQLARSKPRTNEKSAVPNAALRPIDLQ